MPNFSYSFTYNKVNQWYIQWEGPKDIDIVFSGLVVGKEPQKYNEPAEEPDKCEDYYVYCYKRLSNVIAQYSEQDNYNKKPPSYMVGEYSLLV